MIRFFKISSDLLDFYVSSSDFREKRTTMGTEEIFETICLKLTESSDDGVNYYSGIGRIRADNILYERLGMSGDEIIRVLASYRQKV